MPLGAAAGAGLALPVLFSAVRSVESMPRAVVPAGDGVVSEVVGGSGDERAA